MYPAGELPRHRFRREGFLQGLPRVCSRFGGIGWAERERLLSRILDRYRGKGLKCDCMVPFS